MKEDAKTSSYSNEISFTLKSMGIFHLLEDSSTGYSIDISLALEKIAVEIDGPTHLSRTNF